MTVDITDNTCQLDLSKDYTLSTKFNDWDMVSVGERCWIPSKPLYLVDKYKQQYLVRIVARKTPDHYFASITLVNPVDKTEGWFFCRTEFPSLSVVIEQIRVEIERINCILQVFGAGEFLHDAIGNGLRWM